MEFTQPFVPKEFPFSKLTTSAGIEWEVRGGMPVLIKSARTAHVKALLDHVAEVSEGGAWWEYNFPVPSSLRQKAVLKQFCKDLKATVAYPHKTGITVMKIISKDMTNRPWMSLGLFNHFSLLGKGDAVIAAGGFLPADICIHEECVKGLDMSEKFPKRLGTFGQTTYLNGFWSRMEQVHAVAETFRTYHERTGLITWDLTDAEWNELTGTYVTEEGVPVEMLEHDPSVLTIMTYSTPEEVPLPTVDGVWFMRPEIHQFMINQMVSRMSDQVKAEALRQRFSRSLRYNARLLFDGDVAFIQMNEQEQAETLRTNRQSISHFFDVLFDNQIQPELTKVINRQRDNMFLGKTPSMLKALANVEEDNIGAYVAKFHLMEKEGIPLNQSGHLFSMAAGQVLGMYEPPFVSDDDRKFPVPHGERRSVASRSDLRMAGHGDMMWFMPDGCVMESEIGWIFSDFTFADAIEIFGGGDKDDHASGVEVNVIEWDEVGEVMWREPIGYASNGADPATEYYIVRKLGSKHKRSDLNTISLADLPNMAYRDITYGPVTFTLTPRNAPPRYTPTYFLHLVDGLMTEEGAYAKHADRAMIAAQHNIPLQWIAPEETFIDASNPVDINTIRAWNAQAEQDLINSGVAIDDVALKHLPRKIRQQIVGDPNGVFCRLARFHKAEVQRLRDEFEQMQINISTTMIEALGFVTLTDYAPDGSGKPLLFQRIVHAREAYKKAHKIGRLTHQQFSDLGDEIVQGLLNEGYDEDRLVDLTLQTLKYCYINEGKWDDERFIGNEDALLCNGALMGLLIKALKTLNF